MPDSAHLKLRPLVLLGIVTSIVTGVALGVTMHRAWFVADEEHTTARSVQEVIDRVRESYVNEVPESQLVDSALRGIMDGLDDHSDFLDEVEFGDLQAETTGSFAGVGIELGLVEDYFTVIAPLDHSPAQRAGLQAGDRIVGVEGESLRGMKLKEVVGLLRGKPGSTVTLDIEREEKTLSVPLTRDVIAIASVTARWLEPGYGYIRIAQFQTDTGEKFSAELRRLMDGAEPLQGLVIDLRNNPGGILQASVAVADTLLEEGLIVYTKGRLPSSETRYRASAEDLTHGVPVAVLINEGSASASEIVAGALRDHGRATLVGRRSYGKGSVQSVMPLPESRAIKLTTAYYFTPSGQSIHKTGIEPDVLVDEAADAETTLAAALDVLKQRKTAETFAKAPRETKQATQ